MEHFYYEEPSIQRKEEIMEYFNEFVENNSDIHGTGFLDKVLDGIPFEEVLEECNNLSNKEYASKKGYCPGKTFLLIRESDNKIIGNASIRWDLNEAMLQFAGHIGYAIRPSERRQGYNKINLYMSLLESKKLGLDRVMLGCSVDNPGSDKTIKALGGVLERSEVDPYDNELTNVYWIDVDDSIEKYKDSYSKYLNEENHKIK